MLQKKFEKLPGLSDVSGKYTKRCPNEHYPKSGLPSNTWSNTMAISQSGSSPSIQNPQPPPSHISALSESRQPINRNAYFLRHATFGTRLGSDIEKETSLCTSGSVPEKIDSADHRRTVKSPSSGNTRYNTNVMFPSWSSFLSSAPSDHGSYISYIPMKPIEANSRFKKYNEIVKSSSSGSVSRLNLKPTGIILGTPSSPRIARLDSKPVNTQNLGYLEGTQRHHRIPQRGPSTAHRQTYSQYQPQYQYQYQKAPSQPNYSGGQQREMPDPQGRETDDASKTARPSVLVRPMSLPLHLKSLKSDCAFKEPYHAIDQSPEGAQRPSVAWTRGTGSPGMTPNPQGTLVTSPTITTRPGFTVVEIKPSNSSSTGITFVSDAVCPSLPSGIPKAKTVQKQQDEQTLVPSSTSKYQHIAGMQLQQQKLVREEQVSAHQLNMSTSAQPRLYGAQPRHSSCGSVGPTSLPHSRPIAMPGPQYLQCALEQYISDLLTGECHFHNNDNLLSTSNKADEKQAVWENFETISPPSAEDVSGQIFKQPPSNQIEALQFVEQRIQNALDSLQQKNSACRYGHKPSRDRSFSFTASISPAGSSSTTVRHQLRSPADQPERSVNPSHSFDPYVNANSDGSPISLTSSSSSGYDEAVSDPHQQQQACYNQLYAWGSVATVNDSDKSTMNIQQGGFDGSMLDQFSEDELRYLLAAVKDLVDLRCADNKGLLAVRPSSSDSKNNLESGSDGSTCSGQTVASKCDYSITTALMHQRLPLGFQHFERYLDSKFGPDQSGQSVLRQTLETGSDQSGTPEWVEYPPTAESSLVPRGPGQATCDSSLWYAGHSEVSQDQAVKQMRWAQVSGTGGREHQPPDRPPRSAARLAETLVAPSTTAVGAAAPNFHDTTTLQSLQPASFESPLSPAYPVPPEYLLEQPSPLEHYPSNFPHHLQPASREPVSPPRPPRSPMCLAPSWSHHSRLLSSPPLHSKLSTRMTPAGTTSHRDRTIGNHHCLHHVNYMAGSGGQPQSGHLFRQAHAHQYQQQPGSTAEAVDSVANRDHWCPTPPPSTSGQGLPAFVGYLSPAGHCTCGWSGPELFVPQPMHQRNTSLEGQPPNLCNACCSSDNPVAWHRLQPTLSGTAPLSSPEECYPMAFGALVGGAHETVDTNPPGDCHLESPTNSSSFFYRPSGGGLTEVIASRCCLSGSHVQEQQQQVPSSRCLAGHNVVYPAGGRLPRSGSAGAGFTYGLEVNGTTSPGNNPSQWGFPSSRFSRDNSVGADYTVQRGWSPVPTCATPNSRMLTRQMRPTNESLVHHHHHHHHQQQQQQQPVACGTSLHNVTLMRSMSNSLSASDLAAYLSGHSAGGSAVVEARQIARSGLNLLPELPSEPALTLVDCTNFFSKVSAFIEIDKNLRPSLPPGWSEERSSTGRMYYYYCYCTNTSTSAAGEMVLRQLATWQHPLIGPHVPFTWERVDSSQHGVYYQNLLIPHCQRHHPNLWLQVPLKNLATEQEVFFSDLRNLQFSMKHNLPKDLEKRLRILEYKNATTDAEITAFIESFSQIQEVEVMVQATHLLDQLFYKELRELIISMEYERIRLVSLMFTMESAEHIFTQHHEPL